MWKRRVSGKLIEYLASPVPEMATEAEILDQEVVHLDHGIGSLTESECRLMISVCNST